MSVANGSAGKEMRSKMCELPSLVSLTIGMCNGTAGRKEVEFHLGNDYEVVYNHDSEHSIIAVEGIDPHDPSDQHHFALAIAIMEEHLDNKKLLFDAVSNERNDFNSTIITELIRVKTNNFKLTYIPQPPYYTDTDGIHHRFYAPKKSRREPYGFLSSLLSWLTYILVGFKDKTYAVKLILEAWHRLPSTDLINMTNPSEYTKEVVPEDKAKIASYIEEMQFVIQDSSERSSKMNAFHFLSEWANQAFDLYQEEPGIDWVIIGKYENSLNLILLVRLTDDSHIPIHDKSLTIKILTKLRSRIDELGMISQSRTSGRYELFTRTRIRTYWHISSHFERGSSAHASHHIYVPCHCVSLSTY